MITPSDLWIAYMTGFAGGTILPLIGIWIRLERRRRADEMERKHWKALSKFRG